MLTFITLNVKFLSPLVDRRRQLKKLLKTALAASCLAFAATGQAAEPYKVGLIIPLTGPFASTGKQVEAGARLYMEQHGDTVAGHKIELIVKDDGGVQPETTKRLAQELVIKDKVQALAGFGLTRKPRSP